MNSKKSGTYTNEIEGQMSETILSVTSSTNNNNSKLKKKDCVTVSLDKRSQQQVLYEDIGNLI